MHGTPSIELGSSKHGPCKLFGSQPLTFKAESRMLRAENICSRPYLELQAQILEAQNIAETTFFCVQPPRKQKLNNLILAMHRTLSTYLKNSKHGQGIFLLCAC
jgi:hypothetical protein